MPISPPGRRGMKLFSMLIDDLFPVQLHLVIKKHGTNPIGYLEDP